MEPRNQSATERRQLRSAIRNTLGVGRDEAPDAVQALRAARDMTRLLELATDGRFTLAVIDQPHGEFIDPYKAIRVAKGTE